MICSENIPSSKGADLLFFVPKRKIFFCRCQAASGKAKGPSIGKIFHHPGDPPAKTDTEVMRTRNGRCSTDILNVEIH